MPRPRANPAPRPHPPLGQLVRTRRREAGLTLARLARASGLATSYLSMIENAKVANPPSDQAVEALARALGDTTGELAGAARWEATPPEVRRQITELKNDIAQAHAVGLDALWRSGALHVLADQNPPSPSPSPTPTPTPAGEESPVKPWPPGHGSPLPPPPAPSGEQGRVPPALPLINKVAAGEPGGYTDLGYPRGVAEEYLRLPGVSDGDAFACTVIGDSMAPNYAEGDLVVFSPLAPVVDGCDAFARLEPEHESTFKRVYFETGGRLRLQPLNPRYPARVLEREAVAGLCRAVRRVCVL